jgi:ubiquinone/menaquinone biosynthesis C-methylase UbiE
MSYDTIIQRLIPWVEYHQNRYARLLGSRVGPGYRWLDIGAGSQLHGGWIGPSPRELAARASLIVGADTEGGHLTTNPDIRAAVVADASRLPFPAATFDLVTANMVVEHLSNPARTFREVARVLRVGGAFAFVTPNVRHPAVWLVSRLVTPQGRRLLGRWADGRHLEHVFETHYLANRVSDVSDLAREAGFRICALEAFPSYPYFRRPAVFTALECLFIRCQRSGWPRRFSSNLVALLEKSAPG